MLLVRFLFSGPARAGLLHADPHPGNFRLLADGRLGVLDFGAVDRLPDGLPPIFGRLLWLMHHDGDIETGRAGAARARIPAPRRDASNLERAACLPGAAGRAVTGRELRVQPGVDARRGAEGRGPAAGQCRQAAEPAAVLRAHSPGLDRRHRRAVPARMRRAVPRRGTAVDTRLRPAARRGDRSCHRTGTGPPDLAVLSGPETSGESGRQSGSGARRAGRGQLPARDSRRAREASARLSRARPLLTAR